MLLYPLPNASSTHLYQTLRNLGSAVSNLRSPSPGWQTRDWLTAYIEWASNAASVLRSQIDTSDVERLVLTRNFRLLASKMGLLYPDMESSGVNHVLNAELAERADDFAAAEKALDAKMRAWAIYGRFVAFDTGVYIESDKLLELDVHKLVGIDPKEGAIRLVVPMAVVDQLDNLKKGGRTQHDKWRAGYTTAVLFETLGRDATQPASLEGVDTAISIELLPDPPGHIRLPSYDDEIVDRVARAQALLGREILFVTFDTGQAFRAGIAGLPTLRLRNAIEDEDEPPKVKPKAAAQRGRQNSSS